LATSAAPHVPYLEVKNSTATVETKLPTSKIGETRYFTVANVDLDEDAVGIIVNGSCKQVFRELPMEFAVEAQNYSA